MTERRIAWRAPRMQRKPLLEYWNSINSIVGTMHMYGGMRHLYCWARGMVQLPLLDCEVIKWNRTRHQVECQAIEHSGTRVGVSLV